jgi:hypothetical protein
MIRRAWYVAFPPLVLGMLAACANPQATRDSAKLLAAYTGKVKDQVDRYAQWRNDLAAERSWNIGLDEQNASALEHENDRALAVFKIVDDKKRFDLFSAIRETTQKRLPPAHSTTAPPPTPIDAVADAVTQTAKARAGKLAEAAKALGQLAEDPDPKDELKFYWDFFSAVDTSIQAARDKEKDEAEQAKKLMPEKASLPTAPKAKAEDTPSRTEMTINTMTKSLKETKP